MVLNMGGTRSIPGAMELQQYASDVFAKMPQRKLSPPETAAIAGMLLRKAEAEEDAEDGVDEELFFPQQTTSCLPLASMAQKKPSLPKEAEMGPIDPNPDAVVEHKSRRRSRGGAERENPERAWWVCMVFLGLDQRKHGLV